MIFVSSLGATKTAVWLAIVVLAGVFASSVMAGDAIVFGSGHIRLGQMVRAGLVLDLLAVVLIPAFTYLLGRLILGIKT